MDEDGIPGLLAGWALVNGDTGVITDKHIKSSILVDENATRIIEEPGISGRENNIAEQPEPSRSESPYFLPQKDIEGLAIENAEREAYTGEAVPATETMSPQEEKQEKEEDSLQAIADEAIREVETETGKRHETEEKEAITARETGQETTLQETETTQEEQPSQDTTELDTEFDDSGESAPELEMVGKMVPPGEVKPHQETPGREETSETLSPQQEESLPETESVETETGEQQEQAEALQEQETAETTKTETPTKIEEQKATPAIDTQETPTMGHGETKEQPVQQQEEEHETEPTPTLQEREADTPQEQQETPPTPEQPEPQAPREATTQETTIPQPEQTQEQQETLTQEQQQEVQEQQPTTNTQETTQNDTEEETPEPELEQDFLEQTTQEETVTTEQEPVTTQETEPQEEEIGTEETTAPPSSPEGGEPSESTQTVTPGETGKAQLVVWSGDKTGSKDERIARLKKALERGLITKRTYETTLKKINSETNGSGEARERDVEQLIQEEEILHFERMRDSLRDDLRALGELFEQGIIDKEHYEKSKRNLEKKLNDLETLISDLSKSEKIREVEEKIEEDVSKILGSEEFLEAQRKKAKKLRDLKKLYDDGVIDKETFLQKKAEIEASMNDIELLIREIDSVLEKYSEKLKQEVEELEKRIEEKPEPRVEDKEEEKEEKKSVLGLFSRKKKEEHVERENDKELREIERIKRTMEGREAVKEIEFQVKSAVKRVLGIDREVTYDELAEIIGKSEDLDPDLKADLVNYFKRLSRALYAGSLSQASVSGIYEESVDLVKRVYAAGRKKRKPGKRETGFSVFLRMITGRGVREKKEQAEREQATPQEENKKEETPGESREGESMIASLASRIGKIKQQIW